jgi:AcrR family transcriptional regulator
MGASTKKPESGPGARGTEDRHLRADARRNVDALLQAALEVFEESGVDAPVRDIAEKAGVGVGTLYRHFPKRADLIAAVFRHEIETCADAATRLAARHEPVEALTRWMQRYAAFLATKCRLAPALHSGDPAYESLRDHFRQRLKPALRTLVESAAAAGEIRTDVDADDLLAAIGSLCMSANEDRSGHPRRMIALLADGLRYGKHPKQDASS